MLGEVALETAVVVANAGGLLEADALACREWNDMRLKKVPVKVVLVEGKQGEKRDYDDVLD